MQQAHQNSNNQEHSNASINESSLIEKRTGHNSKFSPSGSSKRREEEKKELDHFKFRQNSDKNMAQDADKSSRNNQNEGSQSDFHVKIGSKVEDQIMGGGGPGKEGKIGDENIDQNILNEINQQAIEKAEELSLKHRIYEDVVHNSRYLWVTYINVRFYWVVILVVSLIQIVCIAMTLWKGLLNVDFPTMRDLYISSDYRTQRDDSQQTILTFLNDFVTKTINLKKQQSTPTGSSNSSNQTITYTKPRSQLLGGNSMQVIYKCKSCKTLYTAEYIKEIYRFETTQIESHPLWKSLCYYGDSTTYSYSGNIGCPAESYGNRTYFLRPYIQANNLTDEIAQKLFEKNYGTQKGYYDNRASFSKSFSTSNLNTNIEISYYYLGYPFWFNGLFYNQQNGSEFIREFTYDLYDRAIEFESDILEVYAANSIMREEMVYDAINHDLLLILGCCGFIWFYVAIHVKSIFISTASMLNILLSIPVALVFYKLIVQIPYFCVLHVLILLLLLGIGADNLFLYNDTWQSTKDIIALKDDHHKRAAYSFRKASKAIISTSITNFLAFVGTCTSQIMPISAFGIFATISIGMIYMFIIFIIPSYYIFYEKHIEHRFKCVDRFFAFIGNQILNQCKKLRKKQNNINDNNSKQENKSEQLALKTEEKQLNKPPLQNKDQVVSIQDIENVSEERKSNEEQTDEKINKKINQSTKEIKQDDLQHQKSGNSSIQSNSNSMQNSNNQGSEQQSQEKEVKYENFIKKEGRVDRFFNNIVSKYIFKSRIAIVVVSVIWIVIAIWRGSLIDQFKGQEAFFYKEHPLQKQIDINLYEIYNSDNQILVRFNFGAQPQLETSRVSKWNTLYVGDIQWDRTFNPAPKANQMAIYNFCQQLKTFSWTSNDTLGRAPLIQCFMEDFKMWVEQTGQVFPVEESRFHSMAFNFSFYTDKGNNHVFSRNVYLKNGMVDYLQIQVISRGDIMVSSEEKESIFQQWESFAISRDQNAPNGVNDIWQSSDAWPYMILQLAFYQNAINGLVYSLLFAFLVLILSTHNIIISVYAVFIIGSVSASVIGVMNLMGWTLGLTESLGIDLFVGFSVDYIVHVAHGYIESMHEHRKDRVDHTYQNIGLAVFSGAITTSISGIFITVSKIYVLRKFGILIELTIVFSILFGLISFPAFLYLIGPQFKQGDLKHYIWDPLINKCKKKKEQPRAQQSQLQQKAQKPNFEKNRRPDEEDQLYDEDNQYDDDDYEEGEEGDEDDDDYDDDELDVQSDRDPNGHNLNRVAVSIPIKHNLNNEAQPEQQLQKDDLQNEQQERIANINKPDDK